MPKLLLVLVGLALLGFGGYRQFIDDGVSPQDQARCEQLLKAENSNDAEALALLIPKCRDAGMVAMMDARATGQDANATASMIAAANQNDLSAHLLDWAMIGAGIALLAGAAVIGRRRS
ncbi:hypothetical protein [Paracoccus sp. (in: a-proteobacteria)]|uniref:hypothetical protein n=1 Tax=Paracoccus sp. TaxID=267 RepID=UPI0028A02763|nr:hypothetical protein [Paracoccus sp. (in: a-proteobacteria)]